MICAIFRLLLFLPVTLAFQSLSTDNGAHKRPLRAAKRSYELSTRDVKGCLSHNHNLLYVDANTRAHDTQFAANVQSTFTTPALLLEAIEHHTERIDCVGSTVSLYFSSAEAVRYAHEEFKGVQDFLLITSHDGCNEDGERESHMVSETSLHLAERLIVLSVSRVPWKSTFKSLTIDFGGSKENFELRRHSRLVPRQPASTTSGAAAATTSVDYPAAPTFTPASHNSTINIDIQYLDTSILPPDTSLGELTVTGPKLPAGFNIKCKNCTIQGNIELMAGSLTMASPNLDSNPAEGVVNVTQGIINYVEHGYMKFQSNNFAAHIELDSTIIATDELIIFTAPLPAIPITPFMIPGIASVGPEFLPQLSVGFKLSASLEFTYGFQVLIPHNSSIILNVGNITESSQQGFENTNITALPFQALVPSIDLTMTGGFNPQLLGGISFFDGKANAGAGVFLDLPTFTATLSTLSHVNANCENASNTTSAANKVLGIIYDTLTHIDASAEYGLGVTAEAEVDFGGYSFKHNDPFMILSTEVSLPTACVSFDLGKKTYGVPSATGSGATNTASKKTSGARVGIVNPLAGVLERVGVAMGLLGVVSACFMPF